MKAKYVEYAIFVGIAVVIVSVMQISLVESGFYDRGNVIDGSSVTTGDVIIDGFSLEPDEMILGELTAESTTINVFIVNLVDLDNYIHNRLVEHKYNSFSNVHHVKVDFKLTDEIWRETWNQEISALENDSYYWDDYSIQIENASINNKHPTTYFLIIESNGNGFVERDLQQRTQEILYFRTIQFLQLFIGITLTIITSIIHIYLQKKPVPPRA